MGRLWHGVSCENKAFHIEADQPQMVIVSRLTWLASPYCAASKAAFDADLSAFCLASETRQDFIGNRSLLPSVAVCGAPREAGSTVLGQTRVCVEFRRFKAIRAWIFVLS